MILLYITWHWSKGQPINSCSESDRSTKGNVDSGEVYVVCGLECSQSVGALAHTWVPSEQLNAKRMSQ